MRKFLWFLFPMSAIAAALVAPVNNAYAEVTDEERLVIQEIVRQNIQMRAYIDALESDDAKMARSSWCTSRTS